MLQKLRARTRAIADEILADLDEFTTAPAFDDQTMIVLKVR